MKKLSLVSAVMAIFAAGALLASCNGTTTVTPGPGPNPNVGDEGSVAKFLDVEGFEIAPWGCWDNCGTSADVSDGADGGIHIDAIERGCGATYFGVNFAAGTAFGANADIDGTGIAQIQLKVRGTMNTRYCYIYTLGKDYAEDKGKSLSQYGVKLDDEEWKEVTIDVDSCSRMSSCGVFFCDNQGCEDGDWVEIGDIRYLDAEGNIVRPAYIK